ncbi:mucin-2-like [Armigeres subalbatus]|uniref:mucin-2-like n=1 Tax=Armigeres subalbatus TaxID=124917 RepID=UPI002ED16343
MLLQILVLYLCFNFSSSAYVSVQSPYVNSAALNYVGSQPHYHSGYLAGGARYPGHVQAVQLIGSPSYQSYPSYYPYNVPSPGLSFAAHPFQTYGHAAVGPVIYGGVQRPPVIAYAPQPVYPIVTPHQAPPVQPVHVPTATVVPVHIPVAPVKPVTSVTKIATVTPVTTTITKTVTKEEETVSSSTENPHPFIKSRKYKVRRPAIQNQFYDIEERVIIRPVGTALVELEQPASRTETKVTSHTVQTQSNAGSAEHGRAVITGPSSVTQKPQIIHTVYQQAPVQHTQVVAHHPVIIHASSAGHVVPQPTIHHVQPPVPVYVNHIQPVYVPVTSIPVTTPVTTFKPIHHVTTPIATTPAPTSDSSTSFDYDDSVVVEPRGGGHTFHVVSTTEAPLDHSTLDATAKYRICDDVSTDDLPKRGDIAITYASTEATHQSLSDANSTSVTESTSAKPNLSVSASFKNVQVNSRINVNEQRQSQSLVLERQQSQGRSGKINEITATSPRVIIANSLSADQARTNQEHFIRLLSERDSIAEVGYGPNTDTSSSLINTYVRSRVLSATPGPLDSKETSRTVNIRRIIVSRPIETEQEVEVREHTYPVHSTTHQVTSSSDQVPVYTTIKPPAFAHDDSK